MRIRLNCGLASSLLPLLAAAAVFPAGALAQTVTLGAASLKFGPQPTGTTSTAQHVTLSNSGSATLRVSSVTITGTNIASFATTNNCGTSLVAGAKCTVNVTFDPPSSGAMSANVHIVSNASNNPSNIVLSGTGIAATAALSVSPASLAFANQEQGTKSAVQVLTVTNTTKAVVTVKSVSLTGTNASSFATTGTCVGTLKVAGTCTVNVTFTPLSTGAKSAYVTIASTAVTSPANVAVSGTVIPATTALTVIPGTLSFGNQLAATTSAARVLKVTNTTVASVTIKSVGLSGTNVSSFSQTNTCSTALAVGASCTVSVIFHPPSTGAKSAFVSIASTAAGSPSNIPLSGTGAIAVPNVVGLTQAVATTSINAAGLVVGTVTQATSSTVSRGSVISESPAAGAAAAPGSAVNLTINATVAQCTNDHQYVDLAQLKGVYTFNLNRRNLINGQLFYSVGSFNADGRGNILNGVMDSNGPEFPAATQSTFTGTYTIGSDGRARMDIAIPTSGQPILNQSFCMALDSFAYQAAIPPAKTATYGASAHAFVIEDDISNVTSSGELHAQVVIPANSIMQGSWTFGMTGRNHFPTLLPNGPDPRVAFAGYLTLDGSGVITGGEMDEVISNAINGALVAPTYMPQLSLTGTYSIPTPSSGTPTGRGTLSASSNGVEFAQFVFYPYGGGAAIANGVENVATGMVFLETSVPNSSTTPVHVAWAGTGARRKLTTFSAASLNGRSVASQVWIDNPGTSNESEGVGIDVDIWNGAGTFTYAGDRNSASVATSVSGNGTYTVDANGRFAVMVNRLCAPCGYLTDLNRAYAIYDTEDTNSVLLENQALSGPFHLSSLVGGYAFGSRGYIFTQQQTAVGETVTNGAGDFTGTLDTDTQGKAAVTLPLTALETATASSGVEGRYLYQPSDTSFPYAIYIIDNYNAVAMPLGGYGSETYPLLRFIVTYPALPIPAE